MSFLLLQLSPHNQRAALMPMMVGMMVCAVVVVCAVEDHNVDSHVKYFLYPTFSPGVNEIAITGNCDTE